MVDSPPGQARGARAAARAGVFHPCEYKSLHIQIPAWSDRVLPPTSSSEVRGVGRAAGGQVQGAARGRNGYKCEATTSGVSVRLFLALAKNGGDTVSSYSFICSSIRDDGGKPALLSCAAGGERAGSVSTCTCPDRDGPGHTSRKNSSGLLLTLGCHPRDR